MSETNEKTSIAAEPLDALLERYGDLLRNAIAHVCPKNLGLQFDDIEQEARMRLWRALQAETKIENPASYLYKVAWTATLDAVRRVTARREEQLRLLEDRSADESASAGPAHEVPTDQERSPETLAERRLLLRRVEASLARLPEDRRRAVGLHLRGFTPPEIAQLLSWSESKARSLAYRGLGDLRERLAAEGIEYEAG
jgi:RNA polymerase sigma factor (sigma-70 family)